jgi:5-(aminomethyl)-3-furanmethanol phosphate kinase
VMRVVKLGGSLLDLVDWPRRLANWLAGEPPAVNVLVVGGGELAEAIREYDRRFSLGEEAAHWLCVRALSIHAEMAATVLRQQLFNASLVRRFGDLGQLAGDCLAVFDPEAFLRDEESRFSGTPLPHTWAATTDSIAARVAECLGAEELVLLKSAPPPADPTDSAAGYVDAHFAAAARNIRRVRFVDLRSKTSESESIVVANLAEHAVE